METDGTPSPTKEAKFFAATIEFQTFQSTRGTLVAESAREPIMLANAVFSKGIITQDDLHAIRVVPSDPKKAAKLVSLIETTLYNHPYKFESFTSALHSISSLSPLADKISHLYRFNRVARKMKDTTESLLDMNHLSAELNNSKLISDVARIKAAGAANFVDMCSIFLAELQGKELAEPYLSLLNSFPNTRAACATLKELEASKTPVAKSPKSVKEHVPRERLASESGVPTSREFAAEGGRGIAVSSSGGVVGGGSGDSFSSRMRSPDVDSDQYHSADSSQRVTSATHRNDSEFLSSEDVPQVSAWSLLPSALSSLCPPFFPLSSFPPSFLLPSLPFPLPSPVATQVFFLILWLLQGIELFGWVYA